MRARAFLVGAAAAFFFALAGATTSSSNSHGGVLGPCGVPEEEEELLMELLRSLVATVVDNWKRISEYMIIQFNYPPTLDKIFVCNSSNMFARCLSTLSWHFDKDLNTINEY
jgi:hypothetical protein